MRFLCIPLALLLLSPPARADLATDAYQILEKNCHACHGAAVQMSKLDLRTRERTLIGGERGPAVEPTNLNLSFLWRFVTHEQKPEMPPGSKLADADIETLRKWIVAGAPFPEIAATDEEQARREALKKLEDAPSPKKSGSGGRSNRPYAVTLVFPRRIQSMAFFSRSYGKRGSSRTAKPTSGRRSGAHTSTCLASRRLPKSCAPS